jgi:hypothetical protein
MGLASYFLWIGTAFIVAAAGHLGLAVLRTKKFDGGQGATDSTSIGFRTCFFCVAMVCCGLLLIVVAVARPN